MGDTSGTTTVRETERKYESDGPLDADLVAELATATAGAPDRDAPTPREPTEFALSATYDTADLRLARSGLTLRRRRGGSDDGWHLKLPAGADARDEVRLPLGPGQAAGAAGGADPGRAPRCAAGARGGAGHRPPGVDADRRRGQRRRHRHRRPGHRPHPRRADQRHRVGGDRGGAGRAGHPRGARPDREALLGAGVRRSASSSKLGRVLADRIPPAPPRPAAGEDATAGKVVLAYLWEQADAIRAADPADPP